LTKVTTIEIPTDTPNDFCLIYEIPMLKANDIAINPIVPSHAKTLRIRRSEAGNPIFSHFIYSG
jgi:hypothetical protein